MIKSSTPLPILFTLTNADNDSIFTDFVMSSFFLMFENPESSIADYIKNLSAYFNFKDILLLSERIRNKRNKLIPMNQKHIIIMLAIFKANLIIYGREKEILNHALKINEVAEVKDELENFIKQVKANIEAFKKMFKANHGLTSALSNILEM